MLATGWMWKTGSDIWQSISMGLYRYLAVYNPLMDRLFFPLQVWTGTLGILQLEDEDGNMVDIYLGKIYNF